VVVLLGVLACAGLGAWQYDRARTRDTPAAPGDPMDTAPVELAAAVPGDGRVPPGADPVAVTVTGTYDSAHQLIVPGRSVDDQPVAYVVTPLRPATGDAVLVVRGWVRAGQVATGTPTPPDGEVTVTGWLAPSEPLEAATVDPLSLPAGQLASVSASRVLSQVPYPLVDGYVGLVAQDPAGMAAVTPLPVPVVEPGVRWSVQSLAYAIEWWFFALAGVWMWVQALRIERRRLAAGGEVPQPEPVPPPA
jgi:cytochrome oxidase assembly protein ShyY1